MLTAIAEQIGVPASAFTSASDRAKRLDKHLRESRASVLYFHLPLWAGSRHSYNRREKGYA